MSEKARPADPLPDAFASYQEAADFWDTHDTTEYLESFKDVAVQTELKRRRFEVEVDEALMKGLSAQAQERGIVREQEKKRFLELADRLASTRDPGEQSRLKEELARMTFGE